MILVHAIWFQPAAPSLITLVGTEADPAIYLRRHFGANAPNTVAGRYVDNPRSSILETMTHVRSIQLLSSPLPYTLQARIFRPASRHDSQSVLWCSPNGQTYILIRMTATVAGVPYVLNQAIHETESFIGTRGDGLVGRDGLYSVQRTKSALAACLESQQPPVDLGGLTPSLLDLVWLHTIIQTVDYIIILECVAHAGSETLK